MMYVPEVPANHAGTDAPVRMVSGVLWDMDCRAERLQKNDVHSPTRPTPARWCHTCLAWSCQWRAVQFSHLL